MLVPESRYKSLEQIEISAKQLRGENLQLQDSIDALGRDVYGLYREVSAAEKESNRRFDAFRKAQNRLLDSLQQEFNAQIGAKQVRIAALQDFILQMDVKNVNDLQDINLALREVKREGRRNRQTLGRWISDHREVAFAAGVVVATFSGVLIGRNIAQR